MRDSLKMVTLLSPEDVKSDEDDPPLEASHHSSSTLPEDDIQTVLQKLRVVVVYLQILLGFLIDFVIGMWVF